MKVETQQLIDRLLIISKYTWPDTEPCDLRAAAGRLACQEATIESLSAIVASLRRNVDTQSRAETIRECAAVCEAMKQKAHGVRVNEFEMWDAAQRAILDLLKP
jgi:hypothetical protein